MTNLYISSNLLIGRRCAERGQRRWHFCTTFPGSALVGTLPGKAAQEYPPAALPLGLSNARSQPTLRILCFRMLGKRLMLGVLDAL